MASNSVISRLLVLLALLLLVTAAPHSSRHGKSLSARASGDYWFSQITRQGKVAYGDSNHQIFRNVKDFGAKGDGSSDDTAAINSAISSGNRCGKGCDSTTLTPAIIYFPQGTYMISTPLKQHYYTHMVGDALNMPTLKATAGFTGMAVIDADPYEDGGINWFTNQNNFFRQIRNFNIDLTGMPFSQGAGVHWQVAQATSLQNIVFNMRTDGGSANKQVGIFMDNGSGGFMTDLTFNGGQYGAFLGSQQFTSRNMKFNGCQTAIFMNWNWLWTLHGIDIENCGVGIDMANGGQGGQTVGSVLLLDSKISNTPIGLLTVYQTDEQGSNGTLIMENVDMSNNVPVAVQHKTTGATILTGNKQINSFVQGREYLAANAGKAVQGATYTATKPASLVGADKKIFARSKPQYQTELVTAFKSVKAAGAKGDGVTDDTAAIQAIFNSCNPATDIIYFDHGAYVITSTVQVPKNIRITGEFWPLIMAGGDSFFKDKANPKPVFRVGNPGESGSVEISELIFETRGPQPGAILVEWNLGQDTQGSNGLWDVHFRVGGSAGTQLQSDTCKKTPESTTSPNAKCEGAFLLFHVTATAAVYVENCWFWVADHELDLKDYSQINIYNGRGVLIESNPGPVWMWGTASEHNVLYNYQVKDAQNVFIGHLQTETPYFQSNPDASVPFPVNTQYGDPDFTQGTKLDKKAWGVRILESKDVYIYGAGSYSFFENYNQDCVNTNDCQSNMVEVDSCSNVQIFGLSTKAAVNMVTLNGQSAALDRDNRNNFCATIALFEEVGDGSVPVSSPKASSSSSSKSSSKSSSSSSKAAVTLKPSASTQTVQPAASTQTVKTSASTPKPSVTTPTKAASVSTPATPASSSKAAATPETPVPTEEPFIPGVVPGFTPGIVAVASTPAVQPAASTPTVKSSASTPKTSVATPSKAATVSAPAASSSKTAAATTETPVATEEYVPGVIPGFIPGVVPGFTPGVN